MVTRGALANNGETHWELEAADAAVGPWYLLATLPIATTTYTDTNATIPTTTPSKPLGTYDPPPSAKYLATDGLSLIMGGSWENVAAAGETFPKHNRVWYTPPLGTSDVGDDERILNTQEVHGWTRRRRCGPGHRAAGAGLRRDVWHQEGHGRSS